MNEDIPDKSPAGTMPESAAKPAKELEERRLAQRMHIPASVVREARQLEAEQAPKGPLQLVAGLFGLLK